MLSVLHTVLLIGCPVPSVWLGFLCYPCIFQVPGSSSQIFDEHTFHTLFNNINKVFGQGKQGFQGLWMGSLFPVAATLSQCYFAWRMRRREHGSDRREQDVAAIFYNRMLLWLFPPFSQHQSTSQTPQIEPHSSSATLLAVEWHPGWLCQSWGEKPGDTTAPGGDEDRCNRRWQRVAQTTAQN